MYCVPKKTEVVQLAKLATYCRTDSYRYIVILLVPKRKTVFLTLPFWSANKQNMFGQLITAITNAATAPNNPESLAVLICQYLNTNELKLFGSEFKRRMTERLLTVTGNNLYVLVQEIHSFFHTQSLDAITQPQEDEEELRSLQHLLQVLQFSQRRHHHLLRHLN